MSYLKAVVAAGEGLGLGLLSRRHAIACMVAGPAAALPGLQAYAQEMHSEGVPQALGMWEGPRRLWLRRAQAGLRDLQVVYWKGGALDLGAYRQTCVYLRDVGFEKAILRGDRKIISAVSDGRLPEQIPIAAPMSQRVLDALFAIGVWLEYFGMSRPIVVQSAFRHPFYNSNFVEGAVRDSWHTKGRAVDIRIDGVPTDRVAQFGRWLGVGGIGLYQSRGFIHIDDGAQRQWVGK